MTNNYISYRKAKYGDLIPLWPEVLYKHHAAAIESYEHNQSLI